MSYRKDAGTRPLSIQNLTRDQRIKLAKNQQAYYQKYGKPAPAKLVNQSMIMSLPNYAPQLRRATPLEVNYVDGLAGTFGLDATGTIGLIATIAQGASVNQRIGKRAYYKSLLIRGLVAAGTTGTVADFAWLIVYDKRPTGALPAITDILTSVNPNAFMNDNNTGRFEVIRRFDGVVTGNTVTPTTGLEAQNVDIYIPLKKRPITFESAGTGAIGDIDSGALYLITCGSVVAGATAPSLVIRTRTRFTEQ